jgi:hypothetical protein
MQDVSAEEIAEYLDEVTVTVHLKIAWKGVVYHSKFYTQAPKSCSYRVSFWHQIPNQNDLVLHFAEVSNYVALPYSGNNNEVKHIILARVNCFVQLQPDLEEYPELQYIQLASSVPSRLCFIAATAIESRVIFIHNSNFPMLLDSLADEPRRVRGMYVTQNLDHRWDQIWDEEEGQEAGEM